MPSSPPSPSARQGRARRRLARSGVRVLREDNHQLFVSKPAGLPSQGGKGIHTHLVSLLEAYRREAEGKPGRAYVGLVHRLDRNVSGVMVVAKTSKAASRLAAAFRTRPPELVKEYLAWTTGRLATPSGRLTHRLQRREGRSFEAPDGTECRLDYRVVAMGRESSQLEIRLHTGFTHQIRAQLSLIGHPLVGDAKYWGSRGRRPALHAFRLIVPHPVRGTPVAVAAPIPPDLEQLSQRLGIRR